jgi:hypothetical protein
MPKEYASQPLETPPYHRPACVLLQMHRAAMSRANEIAVPIKPQATPVAPEQGKSGRHALHLSIDDKLSTSEARRCPEFDQLLGK